MLAFLLLALQDATLLAEPETVHVGEPMRWALVVEHDIDETVELPSDAIPPDDSWVVLEGPVLARVREGERAFTRLEWTLFSLEAGERPLPAVRFPLSSGVEVEALAGKVEVLGDLSADEDAPRQLVRPLEAPLEEEQDLTRSIPLALGGLAVVLGILLLRRRGRVPAPASVSPPRSERPLAEFMDEPEVLAAAMSTRLREAVDHHQGASRPGLLDDEWLDAVAQHDRPLPFEPAELGTLLHWADEVEFAGVVPTRFALEENVTRAQALLGALGGVL